MNSKLLDETIDILKKNGMNVKLDGLESSILATVYCEKKAKNDKQTDIVSYIVSFLKQTKDENQI